MRASGLHCRQVSLRGCALTPGSPAFLLPLPTRDCRPTCYRTLASPVEHRARGHMQFVSFRPSGLWLRRWNHLVLRCVNTPLSFYLTGSCVCVVAAWTLTLGRAGRVGAGAHGQPPGAASLRSRRVSWLHFLPTLSTVGPVIRQFWRVSSL